MSSIKILSMNIVDSETDAIVNAANSGLRAGSGVCGAVFKGAGMREMTAACDKYGRCDTGNAVITPGFNLPAKYVIHAVGPIWNGGNNNEEKLLYGAYSNSLRLLKENNLHSITFPVISAGIYGYPKEQAWEVAIRACRDFISENSDYDVEIIFAVYGSDYMLNLGNSILNK